MKKKLMFGTLVLLGMELTDAIAKGQILAADEKSREYFDQDILTTMAEANVGKPYFNLKTKAIKGFKKFFDNILDSKLQKNI